jgi:hypothetical protein
LNFLILKIPPITRFKDPNAAILTPEAACESEKIIPEAVRDKLVLAHFPCNQ